MPSSYASSITPIVHLICDVNPGRVIDIGPGMGKYGLLCQEYLPGLQVLDAIEVPEGRQPSYLWDLYDDITLRDVRDFDAAYWRQAGYDLALLIDVIEHMSKAHGHQLLGYLLDAGTSVLLATPQVFFEQHDPANPYEEHVSYWTWEDLRRYRIARDASTPDALIYLLEPPETGRSRWAGPV